jgi:Eco57I restriction-modification methylase
MAPDKQRIQRYLKAFDFTALFIEELGWDYLREPPLYITLDGQHTYTLRPLVEKRGVKVYVCDPNSQGKIPDDPTLRKIEREVTRHAYEHILIYVDAAKDNQVWQWVKREPGKPLAPHYNRLHKHQSGELLAQKLQAVAFEISEEERLNTLAVSGRVREAFDVERVTRKFYDRFKIEHAAFLKLIQGITSQADREWYASLMLNRLMFVYFIQRQGFLDTKRPGALDGDPNYLSNRLRMMQEQHGKDTFHSFYRYFLLRLFHDGLSKPQHSSELEKLLGKIPYLNGGLFDVHILERDNPDIRIPDEAFEKLFDFFDDFDWHLDNRPLHNDKEINPDVLGYIFEKYINQKQMGAYYTKEDITEYISKNTIIPFIFEAAEQKCLIAFNADGPVWSLLRDHPDRYIYDAVKKGCERPLPPEIEVGLQDISRRTEWNKPASSDYALPTEIWREVVARRTRYDETRTKLAACEMTSINDLITYNLDIRQFAQDVIAYCEGTDLLRAFYDSIEKVTVLDPTCGSGAFLFAALTILESLYEACLDRMQIMVEERDRLDAAIKPELRQNRPSINRFREILKQVEQHPSRRYFIFKSIIVNNLYGVDIMEEATEICKLRLFLKLVSQVEKFDDIEPLPDIDFNIRAGNTLVGFATYAEAERAIMSKLDFDNAMARIEQMAQEVERAFHNFRFMQTAINVDPELMAEMKQQVRSQLSALNNELDRYLAGEYGIDRSNIPNKAEYEKRFKQWQQSHQPFHWFVEFYGIMKNGGFDVIIGNPPYVEYSKVKKEYEVKDYKTISCNNLYTYVMERSLRLQAQKGRLGMIVPVSMLCTERMVPLQKLALYKGESWVSSFDMRPSQLFTGVSQRLSIHLHTIDVVSGSIHLGGYRRWHEEERPELLRLMSYINVPNDRIEPGYFPKIATSMEASIEAKLCGQKIADFEASANEHPIYVHRIIRYFVKAIDFIPYFWNETEGQKKSEDYKPFFFRTDLMYAIAAILNSSLFYWFWRAYSDGFHCGYRDVRAFRLGTFEESEELPVLNALGKKLMTELQKSTTRKTIISKATGRVEYDEFSPRACLKLINEIDRLLARACYELLVN